MRAIVVGASSGIGRAVVDELCQVGWRVVGASRRQPSSVPDGCTWRQADVRVPGDCESLVAFGVERLGGLDALVYAAGVAPLSVVRDVTAGEWRDLFATNVVGAALVTSAALPELTRAEGRAVFLCSHSVGRPWPGLVAYAASKAALDELIRGWRAECPAVLFSRVVVGPTATSFADGWDPDKLGPFLKQWHAEGYMERGVSQPAAIAAQVLNVLSSTSRVDEVRVMPPGA